MTTFRRAGMVSLAIAAATSVAPLTAHADGAVQISGVGYPDLEGQCDHEADDVAAPDYTIVMTGDLEGCIYGYVIPDSVRERPSGTYADLSDEIFVSSADPDDRFTTMSWYTAKFTDDGQQFGRCQHPISGGDGAYEGVTGRLDFKDNVVDGAAVSYDYRGHIKLA